MQKVETNPSPFAMQCLAFVNSCNTIVFQSIFRR